MGTNATGKTSLGKTLLKIFGSIKEANEAILRDLETGDIYCTHNSGHGRF